MRATSDTAFGDLLRTVDTLLDAPPPAGADRAHTDVVADFAGYLAQRMTELHDRRQTEANGFLTWLEAHIGTPVDALVGKAKVREYWKLPGGADELLAMLERNFPRVMSLDLRLPKRYGVRNEARALIVDGYETSMRRLRPILTQIEITDRLIDQIVYRLYGMSPEEVAVVETQFAGGAPDPNVDDAPLP